MKYIISIVLLVAVVHGGKFCARNSDCQSSECCQVLSQHPIVSKRDTALSGVKKLEGFKTGTCEPYSHEGDHCNIFGKINGECSCEPGTSCKGSKIAAQGVKRLFRRKLVAGYEYKCTKGGEE